MNSKITTALLARGLAAGASSQQAPEHKSRAIHITKECNSGTGYYPGSYCTIQSSNIAAITKGATVFYDQAAISKREFWIPTFFSRWMRPRGRLVDVPLHSVPRQASARSPMALVSWRVFTPGSLSPATAVTPTCTTGMALTDSAK
jgi:hypothetical protein